MSKDKVYLTVIVLLVIALIAGCALQTQRAKRPAVSEIIIPKDGLIFKTEDGKMIAKIYDNETGGVVSIYNNQGKLAMSMSAQENGGLLIIDNKQQGVAISLGAYETGGILHILNNQQQPAVVLSAFKTGGVVSIHDNQGNLVWAEPWAK